MSNRIKKHRDHTHQSIFYHGLIKLIVCTVLQKKSRTWDHFLFWSGFHNEQEDQPKKRQMNKQYILVKRLKKEIIDELSKDNVQEECFTQKFKEPVCEEVKEVFDVNQEQVSKNVEEDQTTVINQE